MATKIFVSYSHQDSKYLRDDSLLGHLKGLENEGARFWTDTEIRTGADWNARIKSKIKQSNIALTLVSQAFLNSRYCQQTEVREFLSRARSEGLIIFPVILSACDWEQYPWIRAIQYLPRNGRNLEQHYQQPPGKRKALFQEIMNELREQVKAVESTKQPGKGDLTRSAMAAFSGSVNVVNRVFPKLKSFHDGEPERHVEYGVMYEGRGDHIVAKHREGETLLTPNDLKKLSERQLRHISIFHRALEDSAARWEELYQQRRRESPSVKPSTTKAIRATISDMQDSLDRVFDFLRVAGLHIDDHYYLFQNIIDQESEHTRRRQRRAKLAVRTPRRRAARPRRG